MAAQVPPGGGAAAQVQGPLGAAKSYTVYDQYVLEPNGAHLVYVDDAISVADFKLRHAMVHTITRHSVDAGRVPYLPGENGKGRYSVASEMSKKLSKSLLKLLLKLEEDGVCIDNLTVDQIRVFPTGEVKLRGVHLLYKTVLGEATYLLHLRMNYTVARSVIRDLFLVGANHRVPDDVDHLLNLMLTDFGARPIFPEHAGLTPLGLCSSLFYDMLDHLKGKVCYPQHHAILADVSAAAGNNWRRGVQENDLLSETYNFRNGGRDYWVPYNYPHQNQIRQPQIIALNVLGLAHQVAWGLTAHEILVIDGHKVLTLLRNRYAHRMEAILAGDLTWNHAGHDFTSLHSELVTMVKFQRVVATIQYGLYQIGYRRKVSLLP